MIPEEILTELNLEEGESISYFDQFAALMETSLDIDYDTFAEIVEMMDPSDLPDMIRAFFEDIIRGVPDDDTDLYRAMEDRKEVLTELSNHVNDRGAGFFTDELYSFYEWFNRTETVICTPEDGGDAVMLSPCDAMMLYREEKLSGNGYDYDFSDSMPREIDEYTLSMLQELKDDYTMGDYDDDDDGLDMLPDELPADFDAASYVPGETDLSDLLPDIDPYRDGLVDRDNPVIDSVDYAGDSDDLNDLDYDKS